MAGYDMDGSEAENTCKTGEKLEAYRKTIRENIDYACFDSQEAENVDEFVELMADTMAAPDSQTIRVAGMDRPASVVKSRFMKLAYFYASYEEKLEKTAPAVYGLYYRDVPASEGNPQPSRRYVIASNRAEGMEYRVSLKQNDEDRFTVQMSGKEKSFVLLAEQHGACRIECREAGGDSRWIQEMEVSY